MNGYNGPLQGRSTFSYPIISTCAPAFSCSQGREDGQGQTRGPGLSDLPFPTGAQRALFAADGYDGYDT